MKHISKILLEICVIAIATWVSLSFVVVAKDKEPHKPDSFQCPHCGTTLEWSDGLWCGYIECRSGWTAATPNPVTPNDEWVHNYVITNRVWITRDPVDNMPMIGQDIDGRLVP